MFLKEVLNKKGSVTPARAKLSRMESSLYLPLRSVWTIRDW